MILVCASEYDPDAHEGRENIVRYLEESRLDLEKSIGEKTTTKELNDLFPTKTEEEKKDLEIELNRLIGAHIAIKLMHDYMEGKGS